MGRIDSRDLIVWAVLGVLAGIIAAILVPGSAGWFWTIVAGLVGSIVGGFLAQTLNIKLNLGSVFLEHMIISVLGAIIVLAIVSILF
jgi:uncharacterized membrane protein YeaQ/YmgE (transglycosylase-associated protein family)